MDEFCRTRIRYARPSRICACCTGDPTQADRGVAGTASRIFVAKDKELTAKGLCAPQSSVNLTLSQWQLASRRAGPSMLRFTVNDPVTFDSLEAGIVDLNTGGGTVPEPTTLLLVAAGAVAGIARRRERKKVHGA